MSRGEGGLRKTTPKILKKTPLVISVTTPISDHGGVVSIQWTGLNYWIVDVR